MIPAAVTLLNFCGVALFNILNIIQLFFIPAECAEITQKSQIGDSSASICDLICGFCGNGCWLFHRSPIPVPILKMPVKYQ